MRQQSATTNEEQLYNLLKESFFLLDSGDRLLFDRYNLTVPRYYALYHVNANPGISPSQLSQRMLCDKSNISRLIKGLAQEGLICRRAHESDGRTYRLYLTQQGMAVFNRVHCIHQQYNQERLACLTATEHNQLVAQLSHLIQALQAHLQTPQLQL